MSIYSVAQVESLSGIKAHTLRIWEKRYSFLKPERTPTNIRYYSDDQMRQLINIGILIRNGHKISHIDKMTSEEIHDMVSEIVSQPIPNAYQNQVQAMTLAMLEMNEDTFTKIFHKQVTKSGLLDTMLQVVYPFLKHVGVLWGTSKAIPAQEHFVSNLIRQKLIAAIDEIGTARGEAKRIAFFLPEKEQHELGLLLAAYIAKDLGWKIYYLGQSLPYENLEQIVEITKCDLLMSVSVMSQLSEIDALIDQVTEVTAIPLLLSGTAINEEFSPKTSQVIPIADPFELIRFLKAY